jgi:hypothetical protein
MMLDKSIFLTFFAGITGAAVASAATVISFEGATVGDSLDDIGWNLDGPDQSAVQVVSTANSGAYVGGQGIRTDDGGATFAGTPVNQPGISALEVDVNWFYTGFPASNPSTPTLQLFGWDDDNDDGVYTNSEREVGFNMDNDGDFEFMSGGSELDGNTSTGFSAETWYRLTFTWTAADVSGNRDVTLSGYDLTNDSDLGVINSMTMTAAQFGADPADWDGVAVRMTRGTFDNITVVPEPSAAVLLTCLAIATMISRRRR